MISRQSFRRVLLLAVPLLFAALAASPARADPCDDLARQLQGQIPGISVGRTAANLIYLSHPQAKEFTLGCAGRSYSNQLYARANSRKPSAAFIDLVASATAVIFTLPKEDMLKGTRRCLRQLGLFHRDVTNRYRRLDMRCTRTKHDVSITISRSIDE